CKILQLATVPEARVSRTDIDRSHRIGPSKTGKPRDIIVKFTTYRARSNFYRSRFKLKSYGFPGIFVNEDLTRSRSTLFYQARKLLKERKLLGAWTHDGSVMVRDAGRRIHRVTTESDLAKVKSIMPIPHQPASYAAATAASNPLN
ncbi:uncharacterized protein LOC128553796, partial [Mercenaria mercenaria]|uniref:uncharacterized protein LOC128553796 n=1 Tax=Mercenaria mercenaria TaxID=6596 RepID=UPI00234E5DAC